VLQQILAVAIFCDATAAAAAPLKDVCPTLAIGRWTIVSVRQDSPITVICSEEAHTYIGRKIFVSRRKVIYGNLKCDVVKESVDYSTDELFSAPGHPYSVIYDCRDGKMFIPGFEIGKSCDSIRSGLDGWAFVLRRSK
jgi:hypothetical protein